MASKNSKQTAKKQGVPAVYLGTGGNFKPGYDASLKRDLVHAVLGLANPNALHRFTAKRAQQLIDARDWQKFVTSKKRTLGGSR